MTIESAIKTRNVERVASSKYTANEAPFIIRNGLKLRQNLINIYVIQTPKNQRKINRSESGRLLDDGMKISGFWVGSWRIEWGRR